MSNDGCGAPAGGVTITKDKAGKEAIVEGHVLRGGAPVATGVEQPGVASQHG